LSSAGDSASETVTGTEPIHSPAAERAYVPAVGGSACERRNGIQLLKELSIPDSAITALLLVLTSLTLTPFLAGREFGEYTIPQVLPISTYWPLALSLPLVWVTLLVRAFPEANKVNLKALGIAILTVEAVALPLAFLSAPVVEAPEFSATILPGQPSAPFKVELPFEQRVEVFVTKLGGLPPSAGVFVTACHGSDTCIKDQRGVGGSPVAGRLPRGELSVDIFNFPANARPVDATVIVRYVRRRYW
jgi:hypothetical protein